MLIKDTYGGVFPIGNPYSPVFILIYTSHLTICFLGNSSKVAQFLIFLLYTLRIHCPPNAMPVHNTFDRNFRKAVFPQGLIPCHLSITELACLDIEKKTFILYFTKNATAYDMNIGYSIIP